MDIYKGHCVEDYGLASGRADNNPFGGSTIEMQLPYFKNKGFDLNNHVPNFVLGTINIDLGEQELVLNEADFPVQNVRWTDVVDAETFSFMYCSLFHSGRFYGGMIYYPHPETKPSTNEHHFNRLEVIAPEVENLQYGDVVQVITKAGAFITR